jgi:hypothetical protein
MLQGHFPGLHPLQHLALHLEDMGTTERKVLSLVSQPRSLLDCRSPSTPRAPTSSTLSALQPRDGNNPTPDDRLLLLPPGLVRDPLLAACYMQNAGAQRHSSQLVVLGQASNAQSPSQRSRLNCTSYPLADLEAAQRLRVQWSRTLCQ